MIDPEGVCSGCRIHEEKDWLDWSERFELLTTIVEPYRSKGSGIHDCIVPVTGANDSYFTVHVVKNLLGMNPLLVSHNKYFNTEIGVRNLSNLRIAFDCDILIQNVNPLVVKKITRTTLRELGSMYWPVLAGQTAFPVQTAARKRIPLIIWGAHQGIEQVGMHSYTHEVEMTRRYRKDHDLMGYEADDLVTDFDIITEADIWQFRYPSDAIINSVGIRGIYLNNYIRWDPIAQHRHMVSKFGYTPCRRSRTFDVYDHVDCAAYLGVHDILKSAKHGYSKVVDQLCREIRFGRISRSQGGAIAQQYRNAHPEHMDLFLKWIGIAPSGMDFLIESARGGYPIRKPEIRSALPIEAEEVCNQGTTNAVLSLESDPDKYKAFLAQGNYITVGRGWP